MGRNAGGGGRSGGGGGIKYGKGSKVSFEETGTTFGGEVVVGLFDRSIADEPYYLVQVGRNQVVKNESELKPIV